MIPELSTSPPTAIKKEGQNMSKETAKKLIAELQTNEELKAKIAGITDKDELVKKAVEAGYDVTLEEMLEADSEYRTETAAKTDAASEELSLDELESAAGGEFGYTENARDGHELFCLASYHDMDYSKEKNDWCNKELVVDRVRVKRPAAAECRSAFGCQTAFGESYTEEVICRYIYRDNNGTEHGIYTSR